MGKPHRTIWSIIAGTALACALACPAALAAEDATPAENETPAIGVASEGVGDDANAGDEESADAAEAPGDANEPSEDTGTDSGEAGASSEPETGGAEDAGGASAEGDVAGSEDEANDKGSVAGDASTPAAQAASEDADAEDAAETTYAHEQTAEQDGVTLHVAWNDPVLGKETTFHVYATGGSGAYKFFMNSVGYTDTDGSHEAMVNDIEHGKKDYTELASSYDYQFIFVATGTYNLWFAVQDLSLKVYSLRLLLDITVSDPEFPSVAQRIDAAVAQCDAQPDQSEYGRALWLHDWLLNQLEYDHSFYWCSPEAALCRGLGTCEGYQQTYAKLLDKAGIENGRLVGNGHTWNAVKIEGSWYQVDPTWDDSDPDPGSGYDSHHLYFGLTDELMALAHSDHEANYQATDYKYRSDSLADNYYVHSGNVETWADTYTNSIQQQLDDLSASFTFNAESCDKHGIINSLVAEQLNQRTWSNSYGPVSLHAAGTNNGVYFSPTYSPTTGYLDVSLYKQGADPAAWTVPTLENRMFAGWYADASCTQVYTATTGYAYAKFVPTVQPVRFAGCSLRDDGQGTDKTTLRFCYEFTVPQGTTRVRAGWHWENARTGASGDVFAKNYWLSGSGDSIIANAALTKIERDGTTKFSDVWKVTGAVTYVTPDGTLVTQTEATAQSCSILETAQSIINSGMSDETDKTYTKKIMGSESVDSTSPSFVVYPMQLWVGSYKNGSTDSSTWKAPTFAGYPEYEGYIFAGWYKDQACTEVFTDVKGHAYAKFVPPTDLVRFTGCSLRNDGTGADITALRFCYEFTVPAGTTRVQAGWTWNNARNGANGNAKMKNYWLAGNDSVVANIAFKNITRNSESSTFDSTFSVTGYVSYITPDGTTVTVTESTSRSRTVLDVAQATIAGGAGDEADKAYARSILGTN